MNTQAPIGITGATGHIGGAAARTLAEAGAPLRLIVRDPESPRVPDLPGAEVARASFGDRDAALAALRGVKTLLMVSAVETADRDHLQATFVQAAKDAGVEHIVYTSFLGAAPDAVFTFSRTHYRTEQEIRASGMAFTFLRDSFYLDVLPEFADAEGVIRGPAADGAVSAVARSDVARSAAAVLQAPADHVDVTYELTGPRALTLTEAARIITDVTGRPTSFHDETPAQARESRQQYDPQEWQLEAWISTYTAIASGEVSAVTDDVRRLTGRTPLSLEQLLGGRRG